MQAHRRRADRRAQHFDRERRDERAVDAGRERNAADDAAFGIDRDEAAPGRRAVERVDARQHAGIAARVRRDGGCADASLRAASRTVNGGARSGMPVGSGVPATTSTAPAAASARASTASFDGRPASASSERGVVRAGAGEQPFRRQRVGFGHQDVERDGRRLVRG